MWDRVQAIVNPVYLVGGSVRDQLMGKEPNDYDFASPLNPDAIEQCVRNAGKHPYLVGKRFGTVGMKIDGQMVEITTFRWEKYTPGKRKPQVEFVTSLVDDLSRRDFTINAIAHQDGEYIDPFNGRQDIEAGVIRCVGKPKDRFNDDPLRMLRAVRFAARLGFSVEPATLKYIGKMAPQILIVSKERWMQELDAILLSDNVALGLALLMATRLLNFILPEVAAMECYDQNSPYHKYDLWQHTLMVVENTPKDVELRWAALLHDVGKPATRTPNKRGHSNYIDHEKLGAEMVVKIGLYLRWSKDRLKNVSELIRTHLEESNPLRQADQRAK